MTLSTITRHLFILCVLLLTAFIAPAQVQLPDLQRADSSDYVLVSDTIGEWRPVHRDSLMRENDPLFTRHLANDITTQDTTGWGNHYNDQAIQDSIAAHRIDIDNINLTETDPTVPSHVKNITTTDINNWNTDESAPTLVSDQVVYGSYKQSSKFTFDNGLLSINGGGNSQLLKITNSAGWVASPLRFYAGSDEVGKVISDDSNKLLGLQASTGYGVSLRSDGANRIVLTPTDNYWYDLAEANNPPYLMGYDNSTGIVYRTTANYLKSSFSLSTVSGDMRITDTNSGSLFNFRGVNGITLSPASNNTIVLDGAGLGATDFSVSYNSGLARVYDQNGNDFYINAGEGITAGASGNQVTLNVDKYNAAVHWDEKTVASSGSTYLLDLNQTYFTNNMSANLSSNRVTVNTGAGGYYKITLAQENPQITDSGSELLEFMIYVNGSEEAKFRQGVNNTWAETRTHMQVVSLSAGDYVEIRARRFTNNKKIPSGQLYIEKVN